MIEVAIVGAGPYGLSIAAYFRCQGIPFRIFGRPMDSWVSHMPKGSCLKSDGFASNIYDPENEFTLQKFCAEQGIEYAHTGIPVRIETFSAYGIAFKNRMLPELDERLVENIDRAREGFVLRLEGGEIVEARRVILAVGISHFEYVPENLAHLPEEFLTHSYHHENLEGFQGRSVVVIGAGASAIDLAGLLRDAGADVQLVARPTELRFHTAPKDSKPRTWWDNLRHPSSGLGPGLRSRFFSDAPNWFFFLPESLRLKLVKKSLGPSAGWFARDKLMGRVPLNLGFTPEGAEVQDGKVHLHLRGKDGSRREIVTDHMVAATGYKVTMERLKFLGADIRSKIETVDGAPVLKSTFECSLPGLYFVGLAAKNNFGPVMRFAFGASFAAQNLTRTMVKSLKRNRAAVQVRNVASIAD
jgi:Pyridine nucleotide-disulphide oxidoreductase